MKEATAEGSMTIVTIVIIVALAAAAAIVVGVMANNARGEAAKTQDGYECTEGTNGTIKCAKKSS